MLVVLTRGPVDDSDPVLAAAALYNSGPSDSGVVCVGWFPVESADIGSEVVAEIQSGTPFTEAARVYSIDPGLAASRGVWLSPDDEECFLSVELKDQLATALRGLPAGVPVAVDFEGSPWVVMARPFESLSEEGRCEVFALLDFLS